MKKRLANTNRSSSGSIGMLKKAKVRITFLMNALLGRLCLELNQEQGFDLWLSEMKQDLYDAVSSLPDEIKNRSLLALERWAKPISEESTFIMGTPVQERRQSNWREIHVNSSSMMNLSSNSMGNRSRSRLSGTIELLMDQIDKALENDAFQTECVQVPLEWSHSPVKRSMSEESWISPVEEDSISRLLRENPLSAVFLEMCLDILRTMNQKVEAGCDLGELRQDAQGIDLVTLGDLLSDKLTPTLFMRKLKNERRLEFPQVLRRIRREINGGLGVSEVCRRIESPERELFVELILRDNFWNIVAGDKDKAISQIREEAALHRKNGYSNALIASSLTQGQLRDLLCMLCKKDRYERIMRHKALLPSPDQERLFKIRNVLVEVFHVREAIRWAERKLYKSDFGSLNLVERRVLNFRAISAKFEAYLRRDVNPVFQLLGRDSESSNCLEELLSQTVDKARASYQSLNDFLYDRLQPIRFRILRAETIFEQLSRGEMRALRQSVGIKKRMEAFDLYESEFGTAPFRPYQSLAAVYYDMPVTELRAVIERGLSAYEGERTNEAQTPLLTQALNTKAVADRLLSTLTKPKTTKKARKDTPMPSSAQRDREAESDLGSLLSNKTLLSPAVQRARTASVKRRSPVKTCEQRMGLYGSPGKRSEESGESLDNTRRVLFAATVSKPRGGAVSAVTYNMSPGRVSGIKRDRVELHSPKERPQRAPLGRLRSHQTGRRIKGVTYNSSPVRITLSRRRRSARPLLKIVNRPRRGSGRLSGVVRSIRHRMPKKENA